MADYHYEGDELAIFAHAHNWKHYWAGRLAPFVKGEVLEVGAGIGANTSRLRGLSADRWVCLEPDAALLAQLREKVAASLPAPVETVVGTVSSLPPTATFDTALYIDVLEHIEDDAAEMAAVARHIRPGGHIAVLSPAHQALYSPFDRAIGHHRRYNRKSLLRCTPPGAKPISVTYLDSAGYFLSFANRMMLRQSSPTLNQILFWDRFIVPASRTVDPLTSFRFGKSILGVWQIA